MNTSTLKIMSATMLSMGLLLSAKALLQIRDYRRNRKHSQRLASLYSQKLTKRLPMLLRRSASN